MVGQVEAVTVGDFTIADVNNKSTNGGCSGVTISGSQPYSAAAFGGKFTAALPAGGTFVFDPGVAGPGPGKDHGAFVIQAYDSTPSFMTGVVGHDVGAALPSGVFPCFTIGGIAGS